MTIATQDSFAGRPGRQPMKAAGMLMISTVAWGLSFPLAKAGVMAQQAMVGGEGTWFHAALQLGSRFSFCAIVLALWLWLFGSRLTKREWVQGVGLGFFSAGGLIFQIDGLNYTSASISAFLTQCYCVLIPCWVAMRHRRLPSLLLASCCGLVAVGVAILSGLNWRGIELGRGEWETIVGSGFFMAQILWLERGEFAGNDSTRVSLAMFVTMGASQVALAALVARHFSSLLTPLHSPAVLGITLALAVCCTLTAFLMMNYWQPHLEATQAGLIYCGEPLFASVFALFLPGWLSALAHLDYANERISPRLLVGGGLIIAANLVVLLRQASSAAVERRNRPE